MPTARGSKTEFRVACHRQPRLRIWPRPAHSSQIREMVICPYLRKFRLCREFLRTSRPQKAKWTMIRFTLVISCLALTACGAEKEKAPTGQVVARIAGAEITAAELRLETPSLP